MHQTLAEGCLSHQLGTVVFLQSTRQDFTGTGGAFIHQHHNGLLGQRGSRGTAHILNATAGLRADNGALIKPLPGNINTGLQQTSGIAAKIENIAIHPLRFEFTDRSPHLLGGVGIELLQADIAHLLATRSRVQLTVDRMNFNPGTHQRHINHRTLTSQAKNHLGAFLAANQLDSILRGHPTGGGAVDRHDDVLGHHPRPGCRRSLDRRDHDDFLGVFVE